jgi:ATP-dependent DNA helicase DinG
MAIQMKNDTHANEIIYELPTNTPKRRLNGGAFLFAAYGCALTERQTPSGMYIYTAINITTGKHVILSRRKVRLAESGHEGMAAKISALPIRGNGVLCVDKQPDTSLKCGSLTEIAKHIFNEILPRHGYAVRKKQIELAEHILGVVERRGVTLAESEVGTGKTHAYLIAAALAKRGRLNDFRMRSHYARHKWSESAHMPVVISTSSIALQNAIIRDYIPELSRILMQHGVINKPLTAAIRKGKEHFVCERRLYGFIKNADVSEKALLNLFIGETAPFDLTNADSLSPYIKRKVCVSGRCGEDCLYSAKCRYFNHMKDINDHKIDFQITNHNYFLADALHRAGGKRPLLPHYQLVIIDEAHKFLAAARSMYGLELTEDELPELAREIHTFTLGKSNGGVNVHRFAKRLEEQSRKLFRRLNDNLPESGEDDDAERFPAVMDEDVARCLKNITGITADLAVAVADSRVNAFHRERQSKAVWRLNMINERITAFRRRSRLIHWLEKRVEGESGTDALYAIPKDLNEQLHRDLWSKGVPIILTSGTLSASGDFTRAKDTLGLSLMEPDKLFSASMPSPFDYKNNALLYISENTPFPDNKDKTYIAAIADEVERLVVASHGHAAVLFTSYNAMGQVYSILNRRGLPFPSFRLERGGVHAIERFKRSGNGILFASGALWEGIDIPGDTLSMLIIVKLPFAVPDPIGEYELSLYGGDMRKYKNAVIVPDCMIKSKQGFGRCFRVETDTGVIAFLDCRANERGAYRGRLLAALPACGVTSSVADVKNFFIANKPPAYFS